MQDGDRDDDEAPAEADRSAEEAQQVPGPDWRPFHGLGGLGCLTMVLAAIAVIWLLSSGNAIAEAVGILIIAVEVGLGLWLYGVASARK